MTTVPSLRRQVIAQLTTYPPGNPPTAARLADGMALKGAEARRAVSEVLRGLRSSGLVKVDQQSRWQLTAAGLALWSDWSKA